MANGLLSQIAQGFNFDPGGAFQRGQDQARVNVANDMNLLNQIQAQARQQQIPSLFKRTLMGDPDSAARLAAFAPDTFRQVMNMQQQVVAQEQGLRKASLESARVLPNEVRLELSKMGIAPEQHVRALGLPQVQERLQAIQKTPLVNIEGQQQLSTQQRREQAFNEAEAAAMGTQLKEATKSSEEFRAELSTEANQANQTLFQVGQFEAALNRGARTGPVAEATLGARSFLSAFGLLTPEENQRLTDEQLVNSLGNRMQLAMSKFMKGAISEREQDIMRATVPNLTNTKQGNRAIIGVMREMLRRQREVSRRVNADYRRALAKRQLFDARASADKHAADIESRTPLFNQQMLRRLYKSADESEKDALLGTWNAQPGFVSDLASTNVYPAFPSLDDQTFLAWERNPKNRNKFVIIGDQLTINE